MFLSHRNAILATGFTLCAKGLALPSPVLEPVLSEINSGSMDWVEVYNPHDQAIDLTGYSLQGKKSSYLFQGDCGSIAAHQYMLLVDKDTTNSEYRNGDCKLPFGIKTKGNLYLTNAAGVLLESVAWNNVAYVAGHSFAKAESGEWAATSTQTPFGENIITDEITMPETVDFSSGLHDREIAYIQNPPFGSITNVNLRVYSQSNRCTCNQFQHAHDDSLCDCTWEDVQEDEYNRDLEKIVMPCSVSINVDGKPEFWYDNIGATDSTARQPRTDENCKVAVRGGYSRAEDLKSFNIKIDKTTLPRTWRGLKRLNMVKLPWEIAGGAVTATLYEQFAQMKHFNGMRITEANLTVTVIDPDTYEIVSVEKMGHYALFENLDEDAMDRHGQAARTADGSRLESDLFKLNSFDFRWDSQFDDMPAIIDETNEDAINDFEQRLEAKDGKNTLKLQQVMRDLNGKTNMSFVDAVHKHFDMRNLATWMAVNILCGDSDHFGVNSYIYSPAGSDKYYFTPWDYDMCWKPEMDNGPQASTPQRYQQNFLFGNILFAEELRDEFNSLYEQRIRELQDGLFQRDTIDGLLTKHAEVVEPFYREGEVDREVLGTAPWDHEISNAKEFNSEIMDFDMSPHHRIMGQFDFITQAIEDYTFSKPPPSLFNSIHLRSGDEEGTFGVEVLPMFSPIGHGLETIVKVYKNLPFERDPEETDLDSTMTDHLYADRFYEPDDEDVVVTATVPLELIATAARQPLMSQYRMSMDCADVEECATTQCYVTMFTIDTETGLRSAGGEIQSQADVNDSNCF